MNNIKNPRGTKDFLPKEQWLYNYICANASMAVRKYSFQEISTPIIESASIFNTLIGSDSDIVGKEMYYLYSNEAINNLNERQKLDIDLKKDLVLRPEGTASISRYIYNNKLYNILPQRFFSFGPMFRHERPQKGRLRQFHQFSVESIGEDFEWADAEVISCAVDVLASLGIHAKLEINTLGDEETRKNYREALVSYFTTHKDGLSEASKRRLEINPLRIFDSKNPEDIKICSSAPNIHKYLSTSAEDFFINVRKHLRNLGIEYAENPKLVRGLGYYTHTVFEFKIEDFGAQSTIIAGGRYDGLINRIMELDNAKSESVISSVGWAMGIDRLMILLQEKSKNIFEKMNSTRFAFVPFDENYTDDALEVCKFLRSCGVSINIISQGSLSKSLKKCDQLEYSHAIIYGEDEKSGEYITLRDMKTGKQNQMKLSKIKENINGNS